MKFKSLFFRSKAQEEVTEVELWEVRWTSRYGRWEADTRPELRCFTSKQYAEEFADALRDAFKLIKHTNGHEVNVRRAE